MKKEAYYFQHDANARGDIKARAMRKKYGAKGYGQYWITLEVLREQAGYRLPLKLYTWVTLAEEYDGEAGKPEDAEAFIRDCINIYELFKEDSGYFYAERLIRDMQHKESKKTATTAARSRAGKLGAAKRWGNDSITPDNSDIDSKPITPVNSKMANRSNSIVYDSIKENSKEGQQVYKNLKQKGISPEDQAFIEKLHGKQPKNKNPKT